jgi:hypothetical protein
MSFKFSGPIEFLQDVHCHMNISELLPFPGILRGSLNPTPSFYAKNVKFFLVSVENPPWNRCELQASG